jgi:SAM-dependent methyltransferase
VFTKATSECFLRKCIELIGNREIQAERVRRYFDGIGIENSRVWYPTLYSWELEKLVSVVGLEGRSVLDIGCGAGNLALAAAARGAVASASDISIEAVEATKKHSKQLDLPVYAVQSDGLEYWISKNSKFDLIVCNPPCVDILSDIDHPNDDPLSNSYLLKVVLNNYHTLLNDKGCFLSVVSGKRNMDFVRTRTSPDIEPFVRYRQIPINEPMPRNIEKLAADGLIEKIGRHVYWNAYYFGFFCF